MKQNLTLALVRKLVAREIVRLRRKRLPHLETVTIRVAWEDLADPERYGEFFGVPLAEYSLHDSGELKNEVVLFARPLIEDFGTGKKLAHEVRITLLHELGHALGFDEEELERRGLA